MISHNICHQDISAQNGTLKESNSPGMKKSQLDLSIPAQIAGKQVRVTKNTKNTERTCFQD